MKYILAFFILSLSFSCAEIKPTVSIESSEPAQNESMYHSPLINPSIAMNNPYKLDFYVEKTGKDQYKLITTMKLFGGSFYVSPHSTTDFKGKFMIEVAPNDSLKIGNEFTEIPRSKEVFDPHPFVNGVVNWVQEDTRYEYPLIVQSQEDFDIGGKIIFTIEPKCTLEQIPLMFKYKSGVLTVENWKC